MLSLLIKNAFLLDIESMSDPASAPVGEAGRICDVGIENGCIKLFCAGQGACAELSVDADGAFLLPGLIDFHTHLFTKGSSFGVNGDLLLSSGTVVAVDMGTAGCLGYEAFRQLDLLPRTIKIKSFLNLSPLGQPGGKISEPLADSVIQDEAIEAMVKKYPEEIRGIKVRLSRSIVGTEGIRPLEHALSVGERLGLPVCVHTTDPPVPAWQIVERLRPGDIYSHMFHAKGMTILGQDGGVRGEFKEAKKRGVYLEVGNGKANFNFQVAQKALDGGVFPDIISSDATLNTFANSPDMRDLPFVMSKFWNMGMPLCQIAAAVTKRPAECLGLENQAGILAEGRTADLTLLRPVRRQTRFSDSDGNVRQGDRVLVPEMTVLNGRIVYLQGGLELKKESASD